ncbi:hypothetical protein [Enterococcus bulliens]
MKRLFMIIVVLGLFIFGIYYLQQAVDYRQTSVTQKTTESTVPIEQAELTMKTKVVTKEYQLSQKTDDFDQSQIYQGEFPFEKLDRNKSYVFTITLVNKKGERLVTKEGIPLVASEKIRLKAAEGKIVFDLFANQALREQIQELDSFQAKGVLKESEKGD